jgi:uncharacterized protein
MKEFVLITGASEGIGLELAKIFASKKNNLVLVARNKEKLTRIAKELSDQFFIQAVVFVCDLSEVDAYKKVFSFTERNQFFISTLVNNAGFGLASEFQASSLKEDTAMINLNILTLMQLTKVYLKQMIELKKGRIMNLASTASFQPGPYMANYYASKAYVLSFSEAISEEVAEYGITVTAVCPGPTKSEFASRAKMGSSLLLKKGIIMSADVVARQGYEALMSGEAIKITGFLNWILAFSVRFTPRSVIRKIIKKINQVRKT